MFRYINRINHSSFLPLVSDNPQIWKRMSNCESEIKKKIRFIHILATPSNLHIHEVQCTTLISEFFAIKTILIFFLKKYVLNERQNSLLLISKTWVTTLVHWKRNTKWNYTINLILSVMTPLNF